MNERSREIPADRLQQFRRGLSKAGFENVRLKLSVDGELVEFSFRRGANLESANNESAYACVLRILRDAGFRIGFEELVLTISCDVLNGAFLVMPLAEICQRYEGVSTALNFFHARQAALLFRQVLSAASPPQPIIWLPVHIAFPVCHQRRFRLA